MEQIDIFALRVRGEAPPLEIRVLRKWVPDHRPDELHYLVVDKQGGGIQAVVTGDERKYVQPHLKLGSCYNIDGYACVAADVFTSNLSHPAMLRIGKATIFTPIPDSGEIPDEYYEFANRRGLDIQSKKTRGIVDYVGILQRLEDKTTNENKPYVLMHLRDCSDTPITVALWNNIITSPSRFNRPQIDSAQLPKIIGITSLKVQNYKGTLQLKSTNATYVYLNPKAVETGHLQHLNNTGIASDTSSAIILDHIDTLSQILQSEYKDIQGQTFTINGRISEIHFRQNWHYTGCPTCRKTIYEQASRWYCTLDGAFDNACHMYKIPCTISANNESIEAVLFDRAANELLQTPCEQMLAKADAIQELEKLKKDDAQFTITIQKDKKDNICCTVNKACFIQLEIEQGSSATPQPATPTPKSHTATSAKRSLMLTQDQEPTTKKDKQHE